jgi:hypothetical protein
MSLFDLIFKRRPPVNVKTEETFRMLDGYTPRFTTRNGGIYEMQQIRAAVHARATHISKLKVELMGAARPKLRDKLKHAPNQLQTWSQFMYRASSILDTFNTLFIVPVYDDFGDMSGIFTPIPRKCEVVSYDGVPYLKYEFGWGDRAAIELDSCGIMNKFQLKNDFFGESNAALDPTLDVIHIQNEGIQEGVRSAATYRFSAQANNFSKMNDLVKERQEFTEKNLSREAKGGGLLLWPSTYKNIQQIDVKPWVVDADQMKLINESVYQYFGVNEDILQNRAYGDKWTAFYEGAVEPFAIQFSEVTTKMLFTLRERSNGNLIMATANRLQYLSNTEKLNVSTQLLDRGVISLNDAREMWNLPGVEGGDVRIIRGEYWNAGDKVSEEGKEEDE